MVETPKGENGGREVPAPDSSVEKPNVNRPSLAQQLDMLDRLVSKGLIMHIIPQAFPDVDPLSMGLARFYAAHNLVGSIREVRETVQSPETKEILGKVLVEIIENAEKDLSTIIDGSKLPENFDESTIKRHARFYQAAEAAQGLETAIRLGLADQINSRDFPALRAVSDKEIARLRLLALSSRLEQLKTIKGQLPQVQSAGFRAGQDSVSSGHIIDEEIQQTQEQLNSLSGEFLGHQQSV